MIIFGGSKNSLYRIFFISRPVVFVGGLSYGLYLAHVPLMWCLDGVGYANMGAFYKFITIAILGCLVSFFLKLSIELPFEKLGSSIVKKITVRRH